MANLIGKHMGLTHTKFINGATPEKISREGDGPAQVTFK
jgi:hypothetical protein